MFEDRRDKRFGNIFPQAWQKITASESGQFQTENGMFTFATVHPLFEGWHSGTGNRASMPSARRLEAGDYYWKIVSHIPPAKLNAAGQGSDRDVIRVGILHSMTGTMAISETSVAEATQLAIGEINAKGGLLGRDIEVVMADGKSDWPTFARQAERLIVDEQVSAVFGCWTSACRKTVKPVFEKYKHLLFYPLQHEGLEASANIVYTGATPNQQVIPAVKWSFDHLGRRFFLVGSDYVFPRTAGRIIRDQIYALGGEVAGEAYILLGSSDVQAVVQQIAAARPDVILNTINGDTNIAFFKALRAAGIMPEQIPAMSFSIAEAEARVIGPGLLAGDYATWNYFQSIDTNENRAFIEAFRKRYGKDRVTDDPMEAAYFGVKLWAQAVREAGTDAVADVRRTIRNQSLRAPEGMVYIDSENRHTWKTVRVGKIRPDGQFDIVWSSGKPVHPVPWPAYRSKSDWRAFLARLYKGWGGAWANPGLNVHGK
jgi:urea transport system substrate-binding protein